MRPLASVLALLLTLSWSAFSAADQPGDKTEQLIQQKLDEKWQEYMKSDAFEKRVDEVILKFIDKQQQARAEQERSAREAMMKHVAPVDASNDHIFGPADAGYSLIEYSDYECPYCKRFHETVREFLSKHKDVNWVYRHFPLSFHNPGAQKEAEASECAAELGGNDTFWAFTDRIFERTHSNGKGFPISKLAPLAEELGLDRAAFQACLDSDKYKEKVLRQSANGQNAGVTGTPGSFLRNNSTGRMVVVTGAQPLGMLEKALQTLEVSEAN